MFKAIVQGTESPGDGFSPGTGLVIHGYGLIKTGTGVVGDGFARGRVDGHRSLLPQ